MRLIGGLLTTVLCVVAAISPYGVSQSKDEGPHGVIGRVIDGQYAGEKKVPPLTGIVVNVVSPKDELQASNKTGSDGRFKVLLDPAVKYYRILVYDGQDRYWSYASTDPTPNDSPQHDWGDIPLYPQSKQLSAEELSDQYFTSEKLKASHIEADQAAGSQLQTALQADYPSAYPLLTTNDTKAAGVITSLVGAESTFHKSFGRYAGFGELYEYGLIDRGTSFGISSGYTYLLYYQGGLVIQAKPTQPGISGRWELTADSSGVVNKMVPYHYELGPK